MVIELLNPFEVDDLLRYPPGRSQKLALADLIPHVRLPDGEIRFRKTDIEKIVCIENPAKTKAKNHHRMLGVAR